MASRPPPAPRTGRRPRPPSRSAWQRAATSRPMRPKPTTPMRLPVQLDAGERLAVPLLRLHRGVGLRDVARHGEQQRQGQLGGRDDVAARRVHDDDAAARGRVQVDVVDADARDGR